MKDFVFDKLQIAVDERARPVLVDWRGESDVSDPSRLLSPRLTALAEQLEGGDVRIRFNELRYMNSATVKPIMMFLEALSSRCGQIRVEFNNQVQWQVTSFRAMRIVVRQRRWDNVHIVGD